MPQLEGQIASAKIGLARLSSPQLYYVLSGNDFTLDLNNTEEPKIICVGNNPQKLQVYGAVLSLYISRVIELVNRKGQLKSSLIFDEFPTIFFNNMDSLIATARSDKVSTMILNHEPGREEELEVVMIYLATEGTRPGKSIISPRRLKDRGNTSYVFHINEITYHFNISGFNKISLYEKGLIRRDGIMDMGIIGGSMARGYFDDYIGKIFLMKSNIKR